MGASASITKVRGVGAVVLLINDIFTESNYCIQQCDLRCKQHLISTNIYKNTFFLFTLFPIHPIPYSPYSLFTLFPIHPIPYSRFLCSQIRCSLFPKIDKNLRLKSDCCIPLQGDLMKNLD